MGNCDYRIWIIDLLGYKQKSPSQLNDLSRGGPG